MSLYDLFSRGAHRTVEALLELGRASLGRVIENLLSRSFPHELLGEGDVGQLIEEVGSAVNAGERITAGVNVPAPEYGQNPATPQSYSYTVIGRVISPVDPSATVSIPWTVQSTRPLTPEEIRDEAVNELTQWRGPRYEHGEAADPDLIARDVRFQQILTEWGESEQPVDITVLSAYRQQ